MANTVQVALERISSKDKDFRYMGTSDLLAELNGESWKTDPETEKRVCHVLLQQLDDHSGEISGLAVKCLVRLVRHVNEAKVAEMAASLMSKLTGGKDSQRDIASIALRSLLQETPPGPSAHALAGVLPGKLIQGISNPSFSAEVKGECLDVLQDVLQRFGVTLGVPDQERLLGVLLEQLASPKPALRKKASQCLASLAAGMSDELLQQTLGSIVRLLRGSESRRAGEPILRSNIQSVAALSRAVGFRLGPALPELLPLIMSFCRQAGEQEDEIREYCLQALETFVLRSPQEVSSATGDILSLALEFLNYDPNFTDDEPGDAMDQDGDGGDNGDEEDEEEEEEEYSDDEDMSWKVRRAAAKCVSAIITARPEMLQEVFAKACPVLIDRFREREETVKLDVFGTFMDLLDQTGEAIHGHHADSEAVASLLRAEIPKIVKALNRQLREKSIKTRVGVFSVLKELVQVLPDSLTGYTNLVVPGVQKALSDKASNSALKIEALVFTRLLLSSHPAATCQPHLKDLVAPVRACVGDKYYKVTSEALRVTGEMLKVMRPSVAAAVAAAMSAAAAPLAATRDSEPAGPSGDDGFDFTGLVAPVHDAVLSRLTAQDQDQEVKESAISALALLLAVVPDSLSPPQLGTALGLLLERLRNDITRLAAVKALHTAAVSPLHPDMSTVLEPAVAELTAFLRKANRTLRQASLQALNALVGAYSPGISQPSLGALVSELSQLVSDSDLAMAALALELCCTVLACPGVRQNCAEDIGREVTEKVQPRALELVKSPLLQGQALLMLQHFFVEQVRLANTGFGSLLEALLTCGKAPPAGAAPASLSVPVNRAAFSSIAQCIAVLCVAAGPTQCAETVARLFSSLKTALAAAAQHSPAGGFAVAAHASKIQGEALLPLLTLGEVGRRSDMGGVDKAGLEALILNAFSSPSEEVKSAASFCLGSIAAGNKEEYLPLILAHIDDQANQRQYLLLLALKEVIASGAAAGKLELGAGNVTRILALLLQYSDSKEEGVRSVVAECLGKLILIDPAAVLPALQKRTTDPSAFTRATVATGLKFGLLEAHIAHSPVAKHLTPATVEPFLLLIKDTDRHVRKAAVLALGTAAHNKPALIEDSLPELLPLLYDQMRTKPEMVRTVDLGPFKHEIDDGLELRKASFDCMDTLIATPPAFRRIQPASFITPFLLAGLSDKYDDVKMPCHLILTKLAHKSGSAVLAVLDSLLDPLEKTVSRKAKQDAVKQEVDRVEDMVRSALRAVDALSSISNVDSSVRFKAFLTKISSTPHLQALFAAIKQEEHSRGGKDKGEGLL